MDESVRALIEVNDPAWPLIAQAIQSAKTTVHVFPANHDRAVRIIAELRMSARSALIGVILNTGGFVLDHGWLRIYGSGSDQLTRDPISWTENRGWNWKEQRVLAVADDVLGGQFAINWGGISPESLNEVFYFAPDALRWEALGLTYSSFLTAFLEGRGEGFYETARWPRWEEEVKAIDTAKGILVYPFLWAKGGPIKDRHRSVVPIQELVSIHTEMADQLSNQ